MAGQPTRARSREHALDRAAELTVGRHRPVAEGEPCVTELHTLDWGLTIRGVVDAADLDPGQREDRLLGSAGVEGEPEFDAPELLTGYDGFDELG